MFIDVKQEKSAKKKDYMCQTKYLTNTGKYTKFWKKKQSKVQKSSPTSGGGFIIFFRR